MSVEQHIIFDLDDTLIDTSHIYWSARNAFTNLFDHEVIPEPEIIEVFEKIDENNMALYGLLPERYGHSMRETFDHISELYKISSSIAVKKSLEEISLFVPNTIPELIDGALDLLDWTSKRYNLSLLTRGIHDFQLKKLRHHSLDKYFRLIKVVDKKDVKEFSALLEHIDAKSNQCWVVGDSIKSDINPAFELGIMPILYQYSHHTYFWRQEYGFKASGEFYLAKTLADIKSILSNPSQFKKVSGLN
jgi:putative hydrolase of the HAD superfamily